MSVTLSVRKLAPDDVAEEGVSITDGDGVTWVCTQTSDDDDYSSYYWVWRRVGVASTNITAAITGLTAYQD